MRKESRVLVCVTGQKSCARLIHDGAEIAAEEGASLSVVHVAKMGSNFLGSASEAEALEYLFAISKSHSADMMLLRNDDVVHTIAAHARRIGATIVVLGSDSNQRQTASPAPCRTPCPTWRSACASAWPTDRKTKEVPPVLDKSIPYKSLIMRREPAPLPPEPSLPAGFSLRRYRPGDEVHWARIETSVAEFDGEGAARAYFAERFLPRQNLLRERCCFVCAPDGLPVATATAWEEAGERLLHWVSTAPAFQRRGLARAVVLHALHSYPPAPQPVWLGTQTWSHDAILLYDSLGFCLVRSGTHAAAHEPNLFAEGMEILRAVYPPEVFGRLLARSLPT